MSRQRQIIGRCPKCGSGQLSCSFNHFVKGPLTIDSWEHRCPNCGERQTTAFRSDEEGPEEPHDPLVCPYCQRRVEV